MAEPDLREHFDAVHAAAERLVREAGSRVPPRGYDVPPEARTAHDPFAAPEIVALGQIVELARAALPEELSRQVRDAMRELLMALRALIDWYLERMDRPPAAPVEVEDIPIS
jgi:hypothetical protein